MYFLNCFVLQGLILHVSSWAVKLLQCIINLHTACCWFTTAGTVLHLCHLEITHEKGHWRLVAPFSSLPNMPISLPGTVNNPHINHCFAKFKSWTGSKRNHFLSQKAQKQETEEQDHHWWNTHGVMYCTGHLLCFYLSLPYHSYT